MCATYTPTQRDRIAHHFGVIVPDVDYKPAAFPQYMTPIIRVQGDQANGAAECVSACFGMVPHWADLKLAKQTYNARSETVSTKASYRHAWSEGQFCIIPADAIFEPNYETGNAVRWQISHVKDRPLGIAGIWESRSDGPDGLPLVSFSMLTINADDHPLFKRFHKPGEEKRMVVFLEPQQYHSWLRTEAKDAAELLKQYPADQLIANAAPTPPTEKSRQSNLFAA
jgi:putative SOS response-associated peptidase YedK